MSNRKNDGTKLELAKVDFHGDVMEALKDGNGDVWVSIRRVCENLGVSTQGQLRALKSNNLAVVNMMFMTGTDGKQYRMAVLDLDSLPSWLKDIKPNKVKPEVREKLIRYQREAKQVLADYFFGRRQPASAADTTAILDAKYVIMMDNLIAMSHRMAEVSASLQEKILAAVRSEVEQTMEKRFNDELEKHGMSTTREPLVSIRDRVNLHGFYNPSARQMAQIRNYTNDLVMATTGEVPLQINRTCMYRPHQVPLLDRAIEVILRKTEEMTKGGLFDQQDNTPAN